MPPIYKDSGTVLTRREQFAESGYLVLPGLLPESLRDRLTVEVDHWVDDGLRARSIAACVDPSPDDLLPFLELELPAHGELLTYEPLLGVLRELIGSSFVFHHLHSDRHNPGMAGKPWHHDYEPNDDGDPSLLMVHTLHYIGGLDGTIGNLTVLPGSHREPRSKSALAHLGTAELPGEVEIDSLPPGSTVLVNSALLHARRPVPGPDEAARPRYFVDASYCQTGARWRPVKPYWRGMLARARDLGLGGGRWPELFAERHFTEYAESL
ncbi:phytanoyl-CoA dioxygenase family protein [Streptomyces varsoviensis]|uniref:Phytanoyl-CoA dioxygenase n=1 Tax=Streptomyces varsoviensis TaxID=67373 RepID=A0ABR5ITV4_9ACTN|nr:phytanoyl-CoA dioxygenase [Streptomyces varsoviensis]KOG66328.1 phytanoyl-CoA dioxygenase [Streptomyces varsoviensis]